MTPDQLFRGIEVQGVALPFSGGQQSTIVAGRAQVFTLCRRLAMGKAAEKCFELIKRQPGDSDSNQLVSFADVRVGKKHRAYGFFGFYTVPDSEPDGVMVLGIAKRGSEALMRAQIEAVTKQIFDYMAAQSRHSISIEKPPPPSDLN